MTRIITLSRQFGSGGRIVADIVGQKLNIPVFDREILIEASEQSGIAREYFERLDERRTSFLFSLVSAHYGASAPIDVTTMITDNNLFLHTSEAMKRLAASPCVMVGRCADDVLKEFNPLRVFVCADLDKRVENVCKRLDLTPKAAASLIKKTDKARSSYYSFYSGKNWGQIDNYDLCINTGKLGNNKAAEIIIGAINEAKN